MNFNLWLYHSVEVLICDVKLVFWKAYVRHYEQKSAQYQARLDQLEAQLAR